MNLNNVTAWFRRTAGLLATTLAMTSAASEAPTETTDDGFQLVVIEGAAGSRALLSGHFDAAERMARQDAWSRSSQRNFEGQLTRCVAMIKLQRGDRASRSCNAAVRASLRAGLNGSSRTANAALARVARGVLRAQEGNYDGAEDDFRVALELRPQLEAAQRNLDLLQVGAVAANSAVSLTRG